MVFLVLNLLFIVQVHCVAAAAEGGGTERQELRTQAGTSGVQVGVKSTKIYIHIYDRRGEWVSGVSGETYCIIAE